jgi:predicted nucleic-acid-binding protein
VIIADTNLLLRAVLMDDLPQSIMARNFLSSVDSIAIPLLAFCELVWVLQRRHKADLSQVISALQSLIGDDRVSCDRDAVQAGLTFLKAGGDFADGVIDHEGRRLGGQTFVTFDRKAAGLIRRLGRESRLLAAV